LEKTYIVNWDFFTNLGEVKQGRKTSGKFSSQGFAAFIDFGHSGLGFLMN
jgi:hypothetical protein